MKYVVEFLEHDDSYGLCVGQTYRIYSYDEKTNMLGEDMDEKKLFIRDMEESESINSFEMEIKSFDHKAEALKHYKEAKFTLEKEQDNPVWNVVNNVIFPK